MKLSIVSTLYQSAPHLIEFYQRCVSVARQWAQDDFEIVLVNDGSPDDSLEKAIDIAMEDYHVKVVDLSRNFGHHKAMMTGLQHAQGDFIFLIDSDLEEEPEYLNPFAEQLLSQGCDVVYGVQQQRKGGWFERWSGQGFYRMFEALTGLALPKNIVTARLMTRRYVNALLMHTEREVFIAGLWYTTGFTQQPHMVTKHSTSQTSYTFRRKMAVLVNSVTSFSNAPLIGIFYIGLSISGLASLYCLYLILLWVYRAQTLSGWTSVMASIWLLGGMIISFIGVVGIYLSKIYSETKQRPYTIVRQVYEKRKG
ncbi:glycosyltransferase family 2 protein [Pseudomonas sp. DC3000-4b1]|uniref:glycosyltransferase family 2 protein n=1 Tax=unclassified Pseudomonas TaxID=196821 RepID=UPI003CF95D9B